MKKILFFCFLFQSVLVFSQSTTNTQLTSNSFKMYGYIDRKRLDSIDAEYAQFALNISSVTFDYGQLWIKRKELNVKDSKGVDLVFANNNITFVLNFFYFNGWQLDHIYNDAPDNHFSFILKKRNS